MHIHESRRSSSSRSFIPRTTVAAFVSYLIAVTALPSVLAITGGRSNARGKILKEHFDENDLLRAYEEIKSEYHEKAFGGIIPENGELANDDEQAWKLLTTMNPNKKKSKNNGNDEIIRVSMLEHPSDPLCPYVKVRPR